MLVAHNRYQQAGGEDAVVENEVRMLRRSGVEVCLHERSNDELASAGLPAKLAAGVETVWSWRSHARISKLLDEFKPGIVHVHNTLPLISPSIYFAAYSRRIPVVQTLHNYRLACPAGTFFRDGRVCEDCLSGTLMSSVINRCYRGSAAGSAAISIMLMVHRGLGTYSAKVDRYLALTNFARKKIKALGIPGEKIEVKPNFLPDPPRVGKGGGAFVFVGRLSREKGIENLLNAWASVPGETLTVFGDGPLRQELEDRARARQLKVEFMGARPKEEIITAMQDAKAVLVPSVWYEGLPMVVVEAYACGTPVLASDIGSLSEIVRDSKTGFLFAPDDVDGIAAVARRLSESSGVAEQLRIGARLEYDAFYSENVNRAMLLETYEKVLRDSHGR